GVGRPDNRAVPALPVDSLPRSDLRPRQRGVSGYRDREWQEILRLRAGKRALAALRMTLRGAPWNPTTTPIDVILSAAKNLPPRSPHSRAEVPGGQPRNHLTTV